MKIFEKLKRVVNPFNIFVGLLLASLAASSIQVGCALRVHEIQPLTNSAPTVQVLAPALNHYEQAQANTVLIKVEDAQGSGVAIVRGEHVFVWTAAHVVEGVSDAKIRLFIRDSQSRRVGETIFSAKVLARDEKLDIALLWISAPARFFSGASFDLAPNHVGDPVYIVGNFYGEQLDGAVTTGIISQVGLQTNFGPGGIWTIADQMSATIAPGASGGPVFRESSQRVIGLNVGAASNAFIFVPARALVLFATKLNLLWAVEDNGISESEDKLTERADEDAANLPAKPDTIEIILRRILR